MPRLDNRSIIVTGGARGIGAAFAKALAAEGAQVTVCDLLDPGPTVEAITQAGGQAVGTVCDVVDPASVRDLVARAADAFGTVHGLVNNAALFASLKQTRFEDIDSELFDRVLQINVRGTFECIRAVSPLMRQQKYGKIVNISSGTFFKGSPMLLHYVASKGAVVALTRAVARELGADGICVNALAPGLTMSEGVAAHKDNFPDAMIRNTTASRALPREQAPEDLTGAVCFLLSADSDFMTGQTVVVDGGSVMH